MQEIDLKDIEKKTRRIRFDDGILEIFIGMISFTTTFTGDWFFLEIYFMVLVPIISIFTFILLKSKIARPRTGKARFTTPRKLKNILIFVILTNIAFTIRIVRFQLYPTDIVLTLILSMLLVPLPFLFMACFTVYKRAYIIALIAIMKYFLTLILFLLNITRPLYRIIPSVLMNMVLIGMGIIILNNFLKKCPLTDDIGEK